MEINMYITEFLGMISVRTRKKMRALETRKNQKWPFLRYWRQWRTPFCATLAALRTSTTHLPPSNRHAQDSCAWRFEGFVE